MAYLETRTYNQTSLGSVSLWLLNFLITHFQQYNTPMGQLLIHHRYHATYMANSHFFSGSSRKACCCLCPAQETIKFCISLVLTRLRVKLRFNKDEGLFKPNLVWSNVSKFGGMLYGLCTKFAGWGSSLTSCIFLVWIWKASMTHQL